MKTTTRILTGTIAALTLAAPGIALAPNAHAYTGSDLQYVGCVESNGYTAAGGRDFEVTLGRAVAIDIANGASPIAERNFIYNHTDSSVTLDNANTIVNCATEAYLGYGPVVYLR